MNILLVEDNELQGELLREMLLCDSTLKVTRVESGERALLILNDNVFDLIVSDVNLTGMDAFHLVNTVKSGKFNKIKFLMYSSKPADPDEIELAKHFGVDVYIEKTGVQGIYSEIIKYLKNGTIQN